MLQKDTTLVSAVVFKKITCDNTTELPLEKSCIHHWGLVPNRLDHRGSTELYFALLDSILYGGGTSKADSNEYF